MNKPVYICKVDPTGGCKDVITSHQVWDLERFMASQIDQHQGVKVKPEDVRIISVSTEQEYRKYKGYKS